MKHVVRNGRMKPTIRYFHCDNCGCEFYVDNCDDYEWLVSAPVTGVFVSRCPECGERVFLSDTDSKKE